MITASIDSKQVMANLDNVSRVITKGVPRQLVDVAYELLRLSQLEVPHDEGTLQNSGVVEEIDGDVVLGYHTNYAARLHEHPEYRFQKGRKGKYLEDPIRRNEAALGIQIADGMQTDIGKAITR